MINASKHWLKDKGGGGRGGSKKHLLDGGGWSGSLIFFDMLAYVCSNYFGVTWSCTSTSHCKVFKAQENPNI